jgi:hypothetical protein
MRMDNLEQLSLAEMEEFLTTNRHVKWSAVEGESAYGLIERVLKAHQYRRLSKAQKGIVKSCKTVIGSRPKQSGMFWTVRGANAIIALRCCHLNGRFEDY